MKVPANSVTGVVLLPGSPPKSTPLELIRLAHRNSGKAHFLPLARTSLCLYRQSETEEVGEIPF